MKRVVVAALAGLSAGCMSMEGTVAEYDPASVGLPPTGYREQIAAYVREAFFDPYSIRDAEISAPS
jgi:hypothetical protein